MAAEHLPSGPVADDQPRNTRRIMGRAGEMATKDMAISADERPLLVELLVTAETSAPGQIPATVVSGRVGAGPAPRLRRQERPVTGPYRRRLPREKACRVGGPFPSS